jgi:hypothetical protein
VWDVFSILVLLFTCLVGPCRLAFTEEDDAIWSVINYTVDFVFLIDIIIIFNTAFLDENFMTVDDRSIIAKNYMKKWFIVDVLAIVPFDILIGFGNKSN